MYRPKPHRERSGLASVEGTALSSPPPPPSVLPRHRGGKFCPLWLLFLFHVGVHCVASSVMRSECRSPLWSLNMVRHAPVVGGLSQENSSYWIWKLFKQSWRPACLIFMRTLGWLSWWREDRRAFACLSLGSSGDLSQEHLPLQTQKGAFLSKQNNPLRGEGGRSNLSCHCLIVTHSIAPL